MVTRPRSRAHPEFACCGLNCALCPMRHISEERHCTGCGGEGRPSCRVLRCAKEHGGVEFCFQCPEFPCEHLRETACYDSFLPHRNVLRDLEQARDAGLEAYLAQLGEREKILRSLLDGYNDGRKKTLFCTAASLLSLAGLGEAWQQIEAKGPSFSPGKERAALAAGILQQSAAAEGISLKLRRKPKEGKDKA